MKKSVRIKSYPSGIAIHLDNTVEFEELIQDLIVTFKDSEKFFKGARLALSLEGRLLSDLEEESIVNTIVDNSSIDIACIIGKDEITEKRFIKALDSISFTKNENNGFFNRGSLKNGQMIKMDSGIVIMGDVYPGTAVISKRDIIILGGLYGSAHAGSHGNNDSIVIALEISPEMLKIGDSEYLMTEKSKWPIKPKLQAKIAKVVAGRVIVENISKDILKDLH